jgi:hypothetical protein
VRYQDLENTIWKAWHILPVDITIDHIDQALNLLSRHIEWGIELDSVSCEVRGIDYAALILLRRRWRMDAHERSAPPKVPRRTPPGALPDAPDAQSVKSDRRASVDTFLEAVFRQTGKRINRSDLWKKAGYKSRTEFERWERDDPRTTNAARRNFSRLLKGAHLFS